MLVDLMLGGMDGFSFIREVRPISQAPIIVLSAKTDTHDIVAALEAGADDYVTKPFQVKEISARLRALRRRPPSRVPRWRPASAAQTALVLDSRTPARWSWTSRGRRPPRRATRCTSRSPSSGCSASWRRRPAGC